MSVLDTTVEAVPPLAAGDTLTLGEFLRRWEAEPHRKFAELLGGVVYMPSPLSRDHGRLDAIVAHWLGHYELATAGCEVVTNATVLLLKDSPQPDVLLRLLPECGGKTKLEGKLLSGPPELVAEICASSAAYDLHQKLEVYRAAGVPEFLAVIMFEREVRWMELVDGKYVQRPRSEQGVVESRVFPGLRLNVPALLKEDRAAVLKTLEEGLKSAEHSAFVTALAARRGKV